MARSLTVSLAFAALVCAAPMALAQTVPFAKIETVADALSDAPRQFYGHVVARETTDLAFQVAGQITTLSAVEGDTIPKGELIAELDLEPFELALRRAESQADQAARTLDRFEQLEGSSVSQVSVDDARTQLDIAEVAVAEAERALTNARLTAPFDALIAARNTSNFTTISAGTPVVRIHDMSELRIEIDVPEVLFTTAGDESELKLRAKFPASAQLYPVTVREFNAEASDIGQTFSITLGMAPPEDLIVLPGSSVTIIAQPPARNAQIVIPQSALVTSSDGAAHVMVFTPGAEDTGTVTRRAIEIVPTAQGHVAVTSGLEPGEEIIVSGAARLNDGDAVRRFAGFPN